MHAQIKKTLEYYLYGILIMLFSDFKNSTAYKCFRLLTYNEALFKKTQKSKLYKLCEASRNGRTLSAWHYNRMLVVESVSFTVLKVELGAGSLHAKALECLTKILQLNTIVHRGAPVTLDDCVILDCLDNTVSKYANFHTDLDYANFTGHAFNVWYLIKNNAPYGNMFLMESPDYKPAFTPCYINDTVDGANTTSLSLMSHGMLGDYGVVGKITNYDVLYANIENGECLVMTKHMLHRTDLARNSEFKGFNFRVLVKDPDGGIPHKNFCYPYKSYHRYDEASHRLYGCKLLDFI